MSEKNKECKKYNLWKKSFRGYAWRVILSAVLIFNGCGSPIPSAETTTVVPQLAGLSQETIESSPLQVHFLDVGQADCTLVICDDEAMVIDAGNNDDADVIKAYLKSQGIDELKYAIGTHPHEDHIGSMDAVVGTFDVEQLIISPAKYDSKYAGDLLHAAEERDVAVTEAQVGDVYELGEAEFTILAPVGEYDDEWNNWSIALRLVYGENSFIFTGDAELEAEYDMCDNGLHMEAQVYQVGHHGSTTSTSEALMKEVQPEYAVISCGRDNDYGHPHDETMERLAEYGVSVFRTDEQGTIVAVCDGAEITWSTAPEPAAETQARVDDQAEGSFVLNTNTMKFHLPDCGSVSKIREQNYEEYQGSREELVEQGYEPCGSCEP